VADRPSYLILTARHPDAARTCTPRPRATTSRCAGEHLPEPSGSSRGWPAHRWGTTSPHTNTESDRQKLEQQLMSTRWVLRDEFAHPL